MGIFKAAKLADRIIREEVDDPRQWEAELADKQPNTEDPQGGQR